MSIDIDNPLVVFKSDGRMYVMDRPKAMMFEEYAATMTWRTVAERTKAKAVWQYQQGRIDELEAENKRILDHAVQLCMTTPEGYALVPIEPTEAMFKAGNELCDHTCDVIYEAMIQAAQEQE